MLLWFLFQNTIVCDEYKVLVQRCTSIPVFQWTFEFLFPNLNMQYGTCIINLITNIIKTTYKILSSLRAGIVFLAITSSLAPIYNSLREMQYMLN